MVTLLAGHIAPCHILAVDIWSFVKFTFSLVFQVTTHGCWIIFFKFLAFSRGFAGFDVTFFLDFSTISNRFLKEIGAKQGKSTKLSCDSVAWHEQRYGTSHGSCTRDNTHSGRRSIMRGSSAQSKGPQVRYEAKLARCAGLRPVGLCRVLRTHTAARTCFKGGLRSKPPGTYIRIVMHMRAHTRDRGYVT